MLRIFQSLSRISPYTAFVLRIVLGGIFFYAGIIKILDPSGFAVAVSNYRLLPASLINPFATVLPWIEVISGGSLLLGLGIPGGILIISSLLVVFTLALGIDLARGLDISCGCFSTSKEAHTITWSYLVRDLILLAFAVYVFFYDAGFVSIRLIYERMTISRKRR